jgi:hypothetical protein
VQGVRTPTYSHVEALARPPSTRPWSRRPRPGPSPRRRSRRALEPQAGARAASLPCSNSNSNSSHKGRDKAGTLTRSACHRRLARSGICLSASSLQATGDAHPPPGHAPPRMWKWTLPLHPLSGISPESRLALVPPLLGMGASPRPLMVGCPHQPVVQPRPSCDHSQMCSAPHPPPSPLIISGSSMALGLGFGMPRAPPWTCMARHPSPGLPIPLRGDGPRPPFLMCSPPSRVPRASSANLTLHHLRGVSNDQHIPSKVPTPRSPRPCASWPRRSLPRCLSRQN